MPGRTFARTPPVPCQPRQSPAIVITPCATGWYPVPPLLERRPLFSRPKVSSTRREPAGTDALSTTGRVPCVAPSATVSKVPERVRTSPLTSTSLPLVETVTRSTRPRGLPRMVMLPAGASLRASSGSGVEEKSLRQPSTPGIGACRNPEHRRMLRLQAKHRGRPGGARHRRDRDEQLGVLAHDVVGRHGVGDGVVLALQQGRAVEAGEEREPEADDEEHRGDRRVPGVPRQRERREPCRDRTAAAGPLPGAQHRREQARTDDRGHQRDEARQQEQEQARAAAGGERARARRAPGDADHDRDECADARRRRRSSP